MSELATPSQLRNALLRWALVTVPGIVFLGFLSGRASNSGYDNRWFTALDRPDFVPPGWVFGVVWTTLYILMGVAIAMILNARGARGRGMAIGLFCVQLVVNLLWSPLFFAAHQVTLALVVVLVIMILAIATTFAFGRIRKAAAWLMLPYLIWLGFASGLNYEIDRRNPNAEALVPPPSSAEVLL